VTINNLDYEIEMRYLQNFSYIDSIIEYCNENRIPDYEDVIETLNPVLIEKIKVEFKKKRFFRDEKIVTLEDFF
jgi:hypothetical protein